MTVAKLIEAVRRYAVLHTYEARQVWRRAKDDAIEVWQYWCFRFRFRLVSSWPFSALAWLLRLRVPKHKSFGKFGSDEVDHEPLTYGAEIVRATAEFGGNEKMSALAKRPDTDDECRFENGCKTTEGATSVMDYGHESGFSLEEFLIFERADAYMRQQREELQIMRAKVRLEDATGVLKAREVQRMERWKTVLAVSAGAAGVVGFLTSAAVLFFSS